MATAVVLGVLGTGLAAAKMYKSAEATVMAVEEQQMENQYEKLEIQARTQAAWQSATANMKDTAAGNVYQVGNVARQAQQATGAFKAQQGYSGVKGVSPLLALQQQEAMGTEAVSEAQRAADAQLKSLGRETSLLTQGYQRQIDTLNRKTKYLEDNKSKMKWNAFWSGTPDLVNSLDWTTKI